MHVAAGVSFRNGKKAMYCSEYCLGLLMQGIRLQHHRVREALSRADPQGSFLRSLHCSDTLFQVHSHFGI